MNALLSVFMPYAIYQYITPSKLSKLQVKIRINGSMAYEASDYEGKSTAHFATDAFSWATTVLRTDTSHTVAQRHTTHSTPLNKMNSKYIRRADNIFCKQLNNFVVVVGVDSRCTFGWLAHSLSLSMSIWVSKRDLKRVDSVDTFFFFHFLLLQIWHLVCAVFCVPLCTCVRTSTTLAYCLI